VVGRPINEAVRLGEVVEVFRRAMETGHPVARQVETETGEGPRYLDVQASRLATPTAGLVGGLVVVRDVTGLVRTAAMKAEFVANASHELRTPLATLRMAVESLEDEARACGAAEALAETVGILKRHVDRLERLTLDLLDLHAVETAKRRLRLERIPVASVVDWLRREFGPRAERKGLAFEVRAEGAGEAFTSDRQLLELILQNLLENSLKFTEPGGQVACTVERDGREMLFRVADTGCGIAPAEQPRIFERFYQAEASRTGDTKFRGTGLGLAIVKHAVGRLGGGVWLASRPGKGTEVTLRVPDRSDVAEAEKAP